MERVPQAAGQQGRRTSCGHRSGAAGAERNKTLRDVRVTNIAIGIIRLTVIGVASYYKKCTKVIYTGA